jgi:hypothetical protein
MLVKPLQPEKPPILYPPPDPAGIRVPDVITTVFNEGGNKFWFCSDAPNIYPKWPSLLVEFSPTKGMVMLVKPLHPENADSPIVFTLGGMVTLAKPLQFENA